ncbi:MAG: hypothetical protein ABFD83_01285, partial [Armatimonadota bacterium]
MKQVTGGLSPFRRPEASITPKVRIYYDRVSVKWKKAGRTHLNFVFGKMVTLRLKSQLQIHKVGLRRLKSQCPKGHFVFFLAAVLT